MQTELISGMGFEINFYPETIVEEIIQNIKIILTTPIGSVPLDRKFGIDTSLLDAPVLRAQMKAHIAIREAIQRYEPRAEITSIDFTAADTEALEGKMKIRLTWRILDEYL